MAQKQISTGYKAREPQKKIHQLVKENRFTVVVAHRRMGKTVCAINQLIHSVKDYMFLILLVIIVILYNIYI